MTKVVQQWGDYNCEHAIDDAVVHARARCKSISPHTQQKRTFARLRAARATSGARPGLLSSRSACRTRSRQPSKRAGGATAARVARISVWFCVCCAHTHRARALNTTGAWLNCRVAMLGDELLCFGDEQVQGHLSLRRKVFCLRRHCGVSQRNKSARPLACTHRH